MKRGIVIVLVSAGVALSIRGLKSQGGATVGADAVSSDAGGVSAQERVNAFLRVIRWAEGTSDAGGYRRLFGGGSFESFAAHPDHVVCVSSRGAPLCSSAAGAYQFLSSTWREYAGRLGLRDFSPESQDAAAADAVVRLGAAARLERGDVRGAFSAVARFWASVEGNDYGQPVKRLDECVARYYQELRQ